MNKQLLVKTWIGLIVLVIVASVAGYLMMSYAPQASTPSKPAASPTDPCQALRDQIGSLATTLDGLAQEIAAEEDLINNLPNTDPTYLGQLRMHYDDLSNQKKALEASLATCNDQKKDPGKQCQGVAADMARQMQQIVDEINRLNASIGLITNPADQQTLRNLIDSLNALRLQMADLLAKCAPTPPPTKKPTATATSTKAPTSKPTPTTTKMPTNKPSAVPTPIKTGTTTPPK